MFAAGLRKIFLPQGSHCPLSHGRCRRRHFRRACEWTIEQAFASYEFQHRERQSDAASGLHFSDQRTRAVAFHSDAWFAMNRGEDALKDAVDLGVVFARENDEWFSCQLFQRDSQLPA